MGAVTHPLLYQAVSLGDLSQHFIPPRFVSGHNKHFQLTWLDHHNGPVYSETEYGGHYKYCMLLAQDGPAVELGVLVNRPLIDLKRATENLSDHFHYKSFTTLVSVFFIKSCTFLIRITNLLILIDVLL